MGDASSYSGDPDAGATGTTDAPGDTTPTSSSGPTSTTVPGASSTSTTQGPNPTPKPADPPVLQVSIHADASSVKAGDRAWFTVQIHNSGGEGEYSAGCANPQGVGFSLAPNVAYGSTAATRS